MDPLFTTGRQIDGTADLVDALHRQNNERRFFAVDLESSVPMESQFAAQVQANSRVTTALMQYLTADLDAVKELRARQFLPPKKLIAMHVNVICRTWGKR